MNAMRLAVSQIQQLSAPWSKIIGISGAFLIGLFIISVVGFAAPEAIHNAAHDLRHGLAFPCH